MIRDRFKTTINDRTILLIFISLTLLTVASITYEIFGHQLLRAMYEGKSTEILNNIIKRQETHSLEYYFEVADMRFYTLWVYFLMLSIIVPIILQPKLIITWPLGRKRLENHTDAIDALSDSHVGLWIILAAGLTLYLELTIIRLHSSYFQLFAYFKNVSLLSCFLGLGIGYARGSTRPLTTPLVLPFLALQIGFMYILRFTDVDTLLQNPISEQISFGINQIQSVKQNLIVNVFLIMIFSFNALCFIPLGHLTSRLMMRIPKLVSYSWNLIGSLVGILVFSFISFLWTPPSIWIILGAIGIMAFFHNDKISAIPSVLATLLVLMLLLAPIRPNEVEVYSPYQILNLTNLKNEPPIIKTSNAYYQRILDLSEQNVQNNLTLKKWSNYYSLPYLFRSRPEDVLIVGSGAGNDTAAAIRNGAGRVDAVEIDPAILKFGKELHPEAPYQAINVKAIVNDARAFIRQTNKRYDLIVYGLLDSHTLLASRSGGIRLDSYVYTVEAFREARNKLKDDGIISLTFAVVRPALGRKLFLMLKEAFDGQEPIVYQVGYDGGYTFLAGNGMIEAELPLPSEIREVTAKFADSEIQADKSTDDWPFFYMPVRKYPVSYVLMILLLFGISVLYIRQLVSGSGSGFSGPCFFLGAGFMLVETKGITELALVYGSTWIVISVVITAILVMAFLANSLIIKYGNPKPLITYGLLFISLAAGLGLTFVNLSSLTPWLGRVIMTTLLTLPLFFSGFAFSSELDRSASVAVALSSNLLGAMLGGFLEYNSMYFGFRSLYILALVAYGLAFVGSIRDKQ